ncbi:MAG: peptide MFS transporter [Ottowia sp.]|nr:peptide MFS transporter [Ottowia sp.]
MLDTSVSYRHPPGLKVIFFTEMWERFSYYSMRALLVLYLVHALGYPRAEALALYGLYTGLVYLAPVFGGYIADRYFGQRQSVVVGSLLMMLGHFAMAVPSLLHMALGLLVLGNGFFKPNTTILVGQLYEQDDVRRDSAYTIFYIGINLGAFLAPLIAGTLGERLGWHWGFFCAGLGMAIALFILLRWQNLLGQVGLRKGQLRMDANDWRRITWLTLLGVIAVYIVLAVWPVVSTAVAALSLWSRFVMGLLILGIGLVVPRYLSKQNVRTVASLSWAECKVMLMLAVVVVFVVVFWMSFEQMGGTLNLFADTLTDRNVLGFEVPASWFQSINPLAIILLGPLFAAAWVKLASRWVMPDPAKLALGMMVAGLAFIVMAYAQERAELFGKVGPQWLLVVYVLTTIGELMLSPIGLSMVSKLAPARLAGLTMGLWFVTMSAGSYLSGVLESWLVGSGIPLYWFLVLSCGTCGLILLLLTPLLQKLIRPADIHSA